MLKDKNILLLTHSYTDFQKNQIEIIAKYFNKVYVLVRYKPIAEISNYFPVFAAKNHTYKNQFDLTNKPDNVTVIAVPLWYLPLDFFYKHLGGYHFRVVEELIRNNDIKFDIIHAHFTWTAGYVATKLKDIYNIPVVLTVHEHLSIYEDIKQDSFKENIINIINKADHVISVNQKNLSIINKSGPTLNASLIHNGYLNTLFFVKNKNECRTKLKLDSNKKIIINIGSLDPTKGHEYLLKSLHLLLRKRDDFLCLIIGTGPLFKALQTQINSLGLQNHVRLTGRITHNALVDWLNASDLFVLPSLSESFGVVQIEAMACGKPVVATKNGGSEEVVTIDDVGYLCEKANPVDLAEKIEMALNRNWDKEKILRHAQNFTWEKAVEKILDIYAKFLQ